MKLPTAARTAFMSLPQPVQNEVRHRLGRYGAWENGLAPEAAPCPPGMTTGPPDFVGVGVPKCGTSWWFSLILAHPDVHPPRTKELMYFNKAFFDRFRGYDCPDEDLLPYHRFFPRPAGSKTGEWTPSYFFDYRLPPLLRRTAPEGKALVMVRDPVERYRSDISRTMPRRRLRNVRYKGVVRGMFAAELTPWEEAFGPDQLLVLQYEACTRDPAGQLAATYRFLGLDDSFKPARLHEAVNKTRAKREIDPGFRRLLVQLYEPDVVALCARQPQIDLALWPNFTFLSEQ